MNTTTLPVGFGLLIATTSTALSMPVVNVDDMIVSARSTVSVEDPALAQNDWDQELNSGFQWADANQNSVANASIEAGASGHGHSACLAEETPAGFRVWSYAYGSSYAKPDQKVEFDVSAGGQFGFEIERRTRVTGYACAWEDAPLSQGQTRAILWGNTDQGFV